MLQESVERKSKPEVNPIWIRIVGVDVFFFWQEVSGRKEER